MAINREIKEGSLKERIIRVKTQNVGCTLQKVADVCGVSREYVRQVLNSAGIATRRKPIAPCFCVQCNADISKSRASRGAVKCTECTKAEKRTITTCPSCGTQKISMKSHIKRNVGTYCDRYCRSSYWGKQEQLRRKQAAALNGRTIAIDEQGGVTMTEQEYQELLVKNLVKEIKKNLTLVPENTKEACEDSILDAIVPAWEETEGQIRDAQVRDDKEREAQRKLQARTEIIEAFNKAKPKRFADLEEKAAQLISDVRLIAWEPTSDGYGLIYAESLLGLVDGLRSFPRAEFRDIYETIKDSDSQKDFIIKADIEKHERLARCFKDFRDALDNLRQLTNVRYQKALPSEEIDKLSEAARYSVTKLITEWRAAVSELAPAVCHCDSSLYEQAA